MTTGACQFKIFHKFAENVPTICSRIETFLCMSITTPLLRTSFTGSASHPPIWSISDQLWLLPFWKQKRKLKLTQRWKPFDWRADGDGRASRSIEVNGIKWCARWWRVRFLWYINCIIWRWPHSGISHAAIVVVVWYWLPAGSWLTFSVWNLGNYPHDRQHQHFISDNGWAAVEGQCFGVLRQQYGII